MPSALWKRVPHPPHPFPLVTTLGSATADLIFSMQEGGCKNGDRNHASSPHAPAGAATAHHISGRARNTDKRRCKRCGHGERSHPGDSGPGPNCQTALPHSRPSAMRGLAAALYLGLAAAYHPPAPCDTLEREKAWVAGSAGAEVSSLRVDGAWLQPVDKGAAPPRCTLSVAMGAAHGEEIARIPSSTLLHTANIHFTRLGASLRHHAAFQPFSPDVSGTNVQVASGDAEGCGEEAALAEEERVAVANPWPWTAAGSAAALVQNDHALLLALHILHEDGCAARRGPPHTAGTPPLAHPSTAAPRTRPARGHRCSRPCPAPASS